MPAASVHHAYALLSCAPLVSCVCVTFDDNDDGVYTANNIPTYE